MTTVTLKLQPQAPLEAGVITPDYFQGKSEAELASMLVFHGNESAPLGDFFNVEGNGTAEIILNGDMSRVKNVATGMTFGKVVVNGNVGMHLGAGMRGGEVVVDGNAGDWAGAEMAGGKIHIRGNAGHGLGGAYRGSRHGMNRGLIIVDGNAGNEAGAAMRRGTVIVMGDAGDFAGAFMIAGSLIVFGRLGIRAGAGLLRGTILAFHMPELLPSFRYDCSYQPVYLKLLFQELQRQGVSISDAYRNGSYQRFSGDFNRLGKGEILVYDQR